MKLVINKALININDTDNKLNTLDELGGKGYNLSIMKKLGLNVPPAFVIPTSICQVYQKDPQAVMAMIQSSLIPKMVKQFTAEFGYMPLLSVRSGAKVSMPGMMDTILNVGLDSTTLEFWVEKLGENCANDSYSRLIEMYSNVLYGIPSKEFEGKSVWGRELVYKKYTNFSFPTAEEQLLYSIAAVFKSWDTERAITYRNIHNIPHDMGTAVVIQAMVFGNYNEHSCTGVLFSRNPSNGENEITGEYLVNAQGEDVVAGTRTPEHISKISNWNPKIAEELLDTLNLLESYYKDMQDVEFTVQEGTLYILQTRNGKRTAEAALKIATDLFMDNTIDSPTLFKRVSMKQVITCMRPKIDPSFKIPADFKGIPASNGIVTGVAVLSSFDAINCKQPCILISNETTPDDIAGMNAALGILTRTGGATSHAAVVARGMDKVCVVGCTYLPPILAGTMVTLNGTTGEIWIGKEVPIIENKDTVYQDILTKAALDYYPVTKIVSRAEEVDKTNCMIALCDQKDPLEHTIKTIITNMDSGYIDLSICSEDYDEVDSIIGNAFGECMPASVYNNNCPKIAELLKYDVTNKAIYLLVDAIGIEGNIANLKNKGYKIVASIDTLEEFIMAEGIVRFKTDFFRGLGPSILEKILKMKKAINQKVIPFKVKTSLPTDYTTINFKGLAMHPKVLLQSILNN